MKKIIVLFYVLILNCASSEHKEFDALYGRFSHLAKRSYIVRYPKKEEAIEVLPAEEEKIFVAGILTDLYLKSECPVDKIIMIIWNDSNKEYISSVVCSKGEQK